jgi:hypothetical protein
MYKKISKYMRFFKNFNKFGQPSADFPKPVLFIGFGNIFKITRKFQCFFERRFEGNAVATGVLALLMIGRGLTVFIFA